MEGFEVGLGLAFHCVPAQTKSGFEPAKEDQGGPLYGGLRFDGFIAGIVLGILNHLMVVGGSAPPIYEMLLKDAGIDPGRVSFKKTVPNTGGNIAAIKEMLGARPMRACIVTSWYHIPRVIVDLRTAGLATLPMVPVVPAESLLLLAGMTRETMLKRLGGGPLARRAINEIGGISQKMEGTYMPKG